MMTRTTARRGRGSERRPWRRCALAVAGAAAAAALMLGGCGGPQQPDEEVEVLGQRFDDAPGVQVEPQCFSVCANEFTMCSGQEHPGEFSRCASQRRACEVDCRERQALRRGEQPAGGDGPSPEEIERFRGTGGQEDQPEENRLEEIDEE